MHRLLAAGFIFALLIATSAAQDQFSVNTNGNAVGTDRFNVNTGYGVDGEPQPLLPGMPPDAYYNTPDCYKGTTVQIHNWWVVRHQLPACQKFIPRPLPQPGPTPQLAPNAQNPCGQALTVQRVALVKTGNDALDMAAGAGREADHMLQVMGLSLAGTIAEFRNPKAFTAKQAANIAALYALFSQPNDKFNAALGAGVSMQIAEMERDPSGSLGAAASGYVLGRGMAAAGKEACSLLGATNKFFQGTNAAKRRLDQLASRFKKALDPLKRGMPLADDTALRNLAKRKQWVIVVRNSNPAAMKWVGREKALPKPMEMKAKSVPYDPTKPMSQQPYAGLASAKGLTDAELAELKAHGYFPASGRGLTDAELAELKAKGFVPDPNLGDVLTTKDGNVFYSDTDLNGVYDMTGKSAWPDLKANEPELIHQFNNKFVDDMVQHGPHDEWTDRNNPAKAGPNFGPQVGNGKSLTGYLPDGSAVNLDTLDQMRAFYQTHLIDFSKIYPGFK